jgi:hypothetical protein
MVVSVVLLASMFAVGLPALTDFRTERETVTDLTDGESEDDSDPYEYDYTVNGDTNPDHDPNPDPAPDP